MAGESVATTIVSLTRVITKSSTTSERFGAVAFFLISILFILGCVVCQQIIRYSPFVKCHVQQCKKICEGEETREGEGTRGAEVDDQVELLTPQQKQISLRDRVKGQQ